MSKINIPQFVDVPNVLLDEYMHVMSLDEFKFVMCIVKHTRQSGNYKNHVRLSITDIAGEMGLTVEQATKAAAAAVTRGVIEQIADDNEKPAWRLRGV